MNYHAYVIIAMCLLVTLLPKPQKQRSSKWPAARKAYLEKSPNCAACSSTKELEVHHIVPFSANPALELEPSNMLSLCESKKKGVNCHLWFGHSGNYQTPNPHVVEDAAVALKRIEASQMALKNPLLAEPDDAEHRFLPEG